ncbi:DUF1858 domain-containing protein [Pseudooceanicola sp.]|uniref:DUF1858 domain-containing protein n=1 Tax=Pseudooceanicola sp. TaxID=1914328 RepID=UPI002619D3E5|nr:DUF1858 domain-containing protein [Pseudooceanicola sp.]MDF1856251.1 DUF1858 domain-containing protein [Pseudooceanicola sp.]
MTLDTLFRHWPAAAAVFFRHKMSCVGCPVSGFHRLADACTAYDLDPEAFRARLRAAVFGPESQP